MKRSFFPEFFDSKTIDRAKQGVCGEREVEDHTTTYLTDRIQSEQGKEIKMPVTTTAVPQGTSARVSTTAINSYTTSNECYSEIKPMFPIIQKA